MDERIYNFRFSAFTQISSMQLEETINRYEELELQKSDESKETFGCNDLSENDSTTSEMGQIGEVKNKWQEKNSEFQKIKNELSDKQKLVVELYATLRILHQKMIESGQNVELPATDDLHVMNVAKLSPEQLLQMCRETKFQNNTSQPVNNMLPVDIQKLYKMPSKLITTCEQALEKGKEVIDWFGSLKSQVSSNTLTKKLNAFNSENEMLTAILRNLKTECIQELQIIEQYIRQSVNDTMAMHLQSEQMTCKLSELNSQNADLRKQLFNAENLRSHCNKRRVEELEKELKEEKAKRMSMKNRLSRAESQVKEATERTSQLQDEVNKAHLQLHTMEDAMLHLEQQNQKLQRNYDDELMRLNETVKENTANLEEIAHDRKKLQIEKDDLEKKITELSMYYDESLRKIQTEMKSNMAKLAETETKYNIEVEEKKKLESHFCAQLLEAESRNEDLLQKLKQIELQLNNVMTLEHEHANIRKELEKTCLEAKNYEVQLLQQTEARSEIENHWKQSQEEILKLKQDLAEQEQYTVKLKNHEDSLRNQLQESETKLEHYETELSSLKSFITQLKNQFGGYENIDQLLETINQQNERLLETNRQNCDISEKLQHKDIELREICETVKTQSQMLQEKDDLIKKLTDDVEEQAIINKQLKNNMELRANVESELNQQFAKKNLEIDSLVSTLETKNNQISQLEKIILTLENNAHKSDLQKRKYEEKIRLLETKIINYESHFNKIEKEKTLNNFEQVLKILEDEMETPFESKDIKNEDSEPLKRSFLTEELQFDQFGEYARNKKQTLYPSVKRKMMKNNNDKNTVENTSSSFNEEMYEDDNFNYKNNMNTENRCPDQQVNLNSVELKPNFIKSTHSVGNSREKILTKNLQLFSKLRNEKKSRMFEIACHRM
ncbi:unnamed protein product [Parnassius apollo]|uniref:(apollo) hypothetical protein n=1 Tax=Parnassius apollo TaxID=110799 RepID=A0A8S3XB00_PARAO|nr:unnamed protein product [Parnassius apollo]